MTVAFPPVVPVERMSKRAVNDLDATRGRERGGNQQEHGDPLHINVLCCKSGASASDALF
jgi:hypothetical protein